MTQRNRSLAALAPLARRVSLTVPEPAEAGKAGPNPLAVPPLLEQCIIRSMSQVPSTASPQETILGRTVRTGELAEADLQELLVSLGGLPTAGCPAGPNAFNEDRVRQAAAQAVLSLRFWGEVLEIDRPLDEPTVP